MFIDQAKIIVRSGKGGDGAIHFRREKYVPRGGPDGGDGGRGGDVILEVNPHLNTLSNFQHKREFDAKPGAKGQRQNMTGRSAEDLIVPVPPGTLVFDDANAELIGDLTEVGQRLTVCKGGRGGRGNQHFATSSNQAPRVAERGAPSEERTLRLELKLIADIGIVGVPNAGKSTFLSVVTNARPKIAPYPFTTLEPNLGVANLDEDTTLILADIPGLIEGAHMGIGLGHDFLRHIQRTRVLIHLLDGMAENPILDFAQINTELALFDSSLAQKPQMIALNKMDLPDVQARWPEIEASLKAKGYEPMAISAVAGTDVRKLLYRAAQLLETAPPATVLPTDRPASDTTDAMPIYRPEEDPRAYTITRTTEGFRVSGTSIERAAAMTYWEEEQSIRRFQNILKALGIEDALRKAGVKEGDTVFIGDEFELEWSE
jgi:GTP-binding protein